MPDYELRPYRPGDEQGIIDTFNLVFSADNSDFVPMTMDYWQWAYAGNPGGIRVWVAETDGLIAAHYASQPSKVWIDGEERIFAQIIDSMVHPEHRAGLKRPGLFISTALEMLKQTCGPDKDLVTYGWPIPEAWRMGKKFLRYEMVRTQLFLSREPGPGASELPAGVEELFGFDEGVRDVWERCAQDWGVSIIRDHGFLNWRFVDHPRFRYRRIGVRDRTGALRGYAVYRTADWPFPGAGLIADWLVPPDDAEAGELLREGALALARSEGAAATLTILPEWSPWFARFQEWGWLAHPSHYLMSGRNNKPRHDMCWLRDRWWYTLAEMDLV